MPVHLFQVRFHPLHPEILASGSLDHEVRLWDAATAECIASRDFCNFRSDDPLLCNPVYLVDSSDHLFSVSDRPIASIAFHAQGELLAVASGHRVRLSCLVLLTTYSDSVTGNMTIDVFCSCTCGITTGEGKHLRPLLF